MKPKLPVYRSFNEYVGIEISPDGSALLFVRETGKLTPVFEIDAETMEDVVEAWLDLVRSYRIEEARKRASVVLGDGEMVVNSREVV